MLLEDKIGTLMDDLMDHWLLRLPDCANTVRPARPPPSSTCHDTPLPAIATDRLGCTQVIRWTEYGMTENDNTDDDETDWDTGALPLRVRAL